MGIIELKNGYQLFTFDMSVVPTETLWLQKYRDGGNHCIIKF